LLCYNIKCEAKEITEEDLNLKVEKVKFHMLGLGEN
jgi:hypothetical protein